jgi:signal peptidase II
VKRVLWLLFPFLLLGADAWSKAAILRLLPQEGASHVIVPDFFNFTLGFNRGAIFGSLQQMPDWARTLIFSAAGLAALFYFGKQYLRSAPSLERFALGLIIGGALGNGLDRLMHGHVVDFIDVVIRGWHYWTFNVADGFIVCGAIFYGLSMLSSSKKISAEPSSVQ